MTTIFAGILFWSLAGLKVSLSVNAKDWSATECLFVALLCGPIVWASVIYTLFIAKN